MSSGPAPLSRERVRLVAVRRRPGWWSVFTAPFVLLWSHRRMVWAATRTDVAQKVAGSTLGVAWYLLYPLMLLAAYSAVYIYVFKVRLGLFDSNEYVLLIFCGLIPFLSFAESLALGTVSVTANTRLVKNTLFPIDLIPVKSVLSTQVGQLGSLVLLLIALACVGRLTPFAAVAVVVWLCQVAFTLGIVWLLSSVNVFLRDVQMGLGVAILLLMMVSPIAYTEEMVSGPMRIALKFNPLYYVIVCYQECLMFGRMPRADQFLPLVAIALIAFCGGYLAFRRLKPIFSDLV